MAPSSGAHEGLMCPLEKGVRGIEIGHQMPGRSWRAGKASGDGKPVGPDRPLERGGRENLTSRHQTTGRVRVFATANTWRT